MFNGTKVVGILIFILKCQNNHFTTFFSNKNPLENGGKVGDFLNTTTG